MSEEIAQNLTTWKLDDFASIEASSEIDVRHFILDLLALERFNWS